METQSKNACPFCGAYPVFATPSSDGVRGPGRRGCCHICGAMGPWAALASDALDAFCHPAHLMASLHTYDPETQVVVSRATAARAERACDWLAHAEYVVGTRHEPELNAAADELRAALEVK